MSEIDHAIHQVEQLYFSVTGAEAPPPTETPYAAIPPERDPNKYVDQQVDRLLKTLGATQQRAQGRAPWVPTVSVWEGPEMVVICVDLPGVSRSSVEISGGPGVIEVAGERPRPTLDGVRTLVPKWQESAEGQFKRLIQLPQQAAVEELKAEMTEGVLELRMPLRKMDLSRIKLS